MQITIEITEIELRKLVIAEIEKRLGEIPLSPDKVAILVKSKQNYKSEWETAAFRASYSVSTE